MHLRRIVPRACATGETLAFALIAFLFLSGTGPVAAQAVRRSVSLPLVFVENRGRNPGDATHVVLGRDRSILFGRRGVTVRFASAAAPRTVTLAFVDACPDVVVRAEDRLDGVVSLFSGPPSAWKTGLATFGRLVYRELWPGIDLEFRAVRNRVKYAFRVRPNADPGRIRLRVTGADRVVLTDTEDLRVTAGPFTFDDPKPVAWQAIGGRNCSVDARYRVEARAGSGAVDVGIELGAYDPARTLVVDPAVLVYGGYIGFGLYFASGAAVDASGRAYVAGVTAYTNTADAFVARVDPTGSKLDYMAIVGGANQEVGWAVAVDATNHAYLVGHTDSDQTTFPVKVGPDLTYNGNDAYIAKLDPAGTNLVYCGYIGGSSYDSPFGVAVDAQGVAWVVGQTSSNDFPVLSGPGAKYSGNMDGFVTRVRADGTGLLSSGYLGGAFWDRCTDVAVDGAGDAYVSGLTQSTEVSFPVLVGPDLTFNGGRLGSPLDGFVGKIRARDGSLAYCGYIGGSGDDWAGGVAVDSAGSAYVAGTTAAGTAPDFPVKVGPYLQRPSSTASAGFVAKVNAAGTALIYSGFIPGGFCQDVEVDRHGRAFLGGDADGTLVVTQGPNPNYGGAYDAFVACVTATGKALEYSGYVGGVNEDRGTRIAVTPTGTAFLIGATKSDERSFPVRVGPGLKYGGTLIDPYDPFVVSIVFTHLTMTGSTRIGQTVTFHATASDSAGLACQFGTALGPGPTPIGSRQLGLSLDRLLAISVQGMWPSVFVGYAGRIDTTGQASASVNLPAISALVGIRIYTAFLTLDAAAPAGVRAISNTVSFAITP